MPVEPSRFPFVAEFLEQKVGTLYVLCDSPVRIRDAVSVVALTRFFAAAAVRLDVRPILTTHRRYLSARNIRDAIDPVRLEEFGVACAAGAPLPALIDQLFSWAEAPTGKRSEEDDDIELVSRGPIVILGRPQLYPQRFTAALEAELSEVSKGLYGRFKTPYNDIEGDDPRFWSVLDQYFNVTHVVAPRQAIRDYGIIRKVRGPFASRTILFAYGTSSLGTIGATQMLIDDDQNERLVPMHLQEHLGRHGEAEVLIAVRRASALQRRRSTVIGSEQGELRPRELRIFLGPSSPISAEAARWIRLLTTDPGNAQVAEVYQHRVTGDGETHFAVVGCHPSNAISARMIGGREVARVVERLRGLGRDLLRTPVLLVGPTGVGKELAARIVHEQRVLALLDSVRRDGFDRKYFCPNVPVFEALFSAINCAGMTETLAESRLFGIRKQSATDVAASPGVILSAGVGTAFLDEISFTTEIQQGRLLRAIEAPYEVTPLGFSGSIPYGSLIVAAMSSDPEQGVREGRFLPELLARFNAGLVRVPPLAEHPGDVPALLCAIARRPIEMDENVLRCLLANDHPLNVRGLFGIVGRAAGPEGQGADSSQRLRITLNDLGASNELREHFELADPAARPRTFVFTLATPPLVPRDAFETAVRVLTSVADSDGTVRLSWPLDKRRTDLGPPSGFSNVGDAFDAWMRTVSQVVDKVADRDAKDVLLKDLGDLFETRFGSTLSEGLRAELRKASGRFPALLKTHIADSVARHSSFLSR